MLKIHHCPCQLSTVFTLIIQFESCQCNNGSTLNRIPLFKNLGLNKPSDTRAICHWVNTYIVMEQNVSYLRLFSSYCNLVLETKNLNLGISNSKTSFLLKGIGKRRNRVFCFQVLATMVKLCTLLHIQEQNHRRRNRGGTGGTCPPLFLGGGAQGGTKTSCTASRKICHRFALVIVL